VGGSPSCHAPRQGVPLQRQRCQQLCAPQSAFCRRRKSALSNTSHNHVHQRMAGGSMSPRNVTTSNPSSVSTEASQLRRGWFLCCAPCARLHGSSSPTSLHPHNRERRIPFLRWRPPCWEGPPDPWLTACLTTRPDRSEGTLLSIRRRFVDTTFLLPSSYFEQVPPTVSYAWGVV